MRRLAPRPLRLALEQTTARSAPAGLLPSVQAVWPEVAGEAVAEESEAVSERDGVVTIACRSAVWAQELELLRRDLEDRLEARLGDAARGLELRFRTASGTRP